MTYKIENSTARLGAATKRACPELAKGSYRSGKKSFVKKNEMLQVSNAEIIFLTDALNIEDNREQNIDQNITLVIPDDNPFLELIELYETMMM